MKNLNLDKNYNFFEEKVSVFSNEVQFSDMAPADIKKTLNKIRRSYKKCLKKMSGEKGRVREKTKVENIAVTESGVVLNFCKVSFLLQFFSYTFTNMLNMCNTKINIFLFFIMNSFSSLLNSLSSLASIGLLIRFILILESIDIIVILLRTIIKSCYHQKIVSVQPFLHLVYLPFSVSLITIGCSLLLVYILVKLLNRHVFGPDSKVGVTKLLLNCKFYNDVVLHKSEVPNELNTARILNSINLLNLKKEGLKKNKTEMTQEFDRDVTAELERMKLNGGSIKKPTWAQAKGILISKIEKMLNKLKVDLIKSQDNDIRISREKENIFKKQQSPFVAINNSLNENKESKKKRKPSSDDETKSARKSLEGLSIEPTVLSAHGENKKTPRQFGLFTKYDPSMSYNNVEDDLFASLDDDTSECKLKRPKIQATRLVKDHRQKDKLIMNQSDLFDRQKASLANFKSIYDFDLDSELVDTTIEIVRSEDSQTKKC